MFIKWGEAVLLLSALVALSSTMGVYAQSYQQGGEGSSGWAQGMRDFLGDPQVRSFVGSQLRQVPAFSNLMKMAPGAQQYQQSYGQPYLPQAQSNQQYYQQSAQQPYQGSVRDSAIYGGTALGQPLPADFPPFDPPATVRPSGNNPVVFSAKLAPAELNKLSRYDISVLIDSSGSMSTVDCPSSFSVNHQPISRWQWCQEQTAWFSQQVSAVLPRGLTLIPFDSKWSRIQNASSQDIGNFFNSTRPDGGTNLLGPLKEEIENYFSRRDSGMQPRPLMLAIITDGDPSNKSALRKVIKDATERMTRPEEIKIVFLLIGTDRTGHEFVDELDSELAQRGAALDIVASHQFAQVNNFGLGRSLARAIR